MLPSVGFAYTWDGAAPTCQKIVDVKLTTGSSIDSIVTAGVVNHPAKTYRVTVNNFLSTGGDGFTVLLGAKDLLGGAQDIDALIDYMAGFKSPNPPYDPNNALLGKPRIQRVDAAASCPV